MTACVFISRSKGFSLACARHAYPCNPPAQAQLLIGHFRAQQSGLPAHIGGKVSSRSFPQTLAANLALKFFFTCVEAKKMASNKTKKEECFEACRDATRSDAESFELHSRSPEQVERLRQTVEKYDRAIALLTFVASQELKSIENFKEANPGSAVSDALFRNAQVYINKRREYFARVAALKGIIAAPQAAGKKPVLAGGGDEDKEKVKMSEAIKGAILAEKPNVLWSDVAGLESAKGALREAVILPIRFPQLFVDSGRKPWSGIMMYGPPGTGKSFLAKAVATEADATFLSVSSADLTSKWLGESEKLVRALFEAARELRPSIVFIDEIDSIATARSDSESESSRRIKTELLVQMDGLGNSLDGLLVLCATNLPWSIDSALRWRCQRRIYISLPDDHARRRLLELHLAKLEPRPEVNAEEMTALVAATEDFSGSDIAVLVRDAIMEPVRICQSATTFKEVRDADGAGVWVTPCSPGDPDVIRGADGRPRSMDLAQLTEIYLPSQLKAPPVMYKHFLQAITRCKPSVSQDDLAKFVAFTDEFGQQ
jgi:vacuolar protein-sorting-associated protein 4